MMIMIMVIIMMMMIFDLVFFHSHKMCLSSIFYSFTDRNGRFLFPFVYFNLLNPYLLIYLINLKPEKGTLLVGASPYGP